MSVVLGSPFAGLDLTEFASLWGDYKNDKQRQVIVIYFTLNAQKPINSVSFIENIQSQ